MGTLNNEKWYSKWVPLLDRYRKLNEHRKIKKMAKKVKNIFDMGLYGVETERVWITWGTGKFQNRIGFDKPLTLKIEDALEEIINTVRADDRGELREMDFAEEKDMPTWNVNDIDNPEKMGEYLKAAEAHKEKWDKERERTGHQKFESREEMEND